MRGFLRKVLYRLYIYAQIFDLANAQVVIKIFFRELFGLRRPIMVTISGESVILRPRSPDLRVVRDNLGKEFNLIKGLLPQDYDGLIVDAGGYIGTAAIALARMYPKATIVTLEPADENFRLLIKNCSARDNIKPLKGALMPAGSENVRLFDPGNGQWSFTTQTDGGDVHQNIVEREIETYTLADLLKRFGFTEIGIIKLDIEGAEKAIFDEESPALLASVAVFAELHDMIVPGCEASFRAFSKDRLILNAGGEKYLSLSQSVWEHKSSAAA